MLKRSLQVYGLPEDATPQQPLIERAEEDLLCAIALYRQGACGYLPLVTVCFLLHQALEKWLKLIIAVRGIAVAAKQDEKQRVKPHDLYRLLTALDEKLPEFGEIRGEIEKVDPALMDHKFPGSLRYNETPAEIERYVRVLIPVAFKTRRLVKRYLNQEERS
mgnify:CR=1 FL=1